MCGKRGKYFLAFFFATFAKEKGKGKKNPRILAMHAHTSQIWSEFEPAENDFLAHFMFFHLSLSTIILL